LTIHSLPEEAPYLHDRWEDQVALEREMLESGRQRMQDRINKARAKRDMTRLRPYRSLIREFITPVAENLRDWTTKASKKRGVKPVALPLLKDVNPEAAAMVSLRAIFRLLGVEKRLILGIAMEIGAAIEHEVRCAAWMEKNPEGWEALEAHYKHRGSDSIHQRRSRVAIFNAHVKDEIGFIEWTKEERQRVGLQMIDCVVQGTGRFKVIADKDSMTTKKVKKGVRMRYPMVLHADAGIIDWLSSAMDDELVFWPVYMPTLIPPKPWDGPKGGGYWTPFVRAPFLIRFDASHETQRQRAIDEYMAIDMPEVYEAINYVQNTPWRINTRVLDVAMEAWDKDLAIGGLPRQEETTVPQRPPEAEDNEEVRRAWAKEASEVRTLNAKRLSKFIGARRTILVAERLSMEGRFYFPHMLDFRGRMYPIPSDLSPQGEDLHRGLLTFSGGKPLGDRGAGWLAVHLANCWDTDKVSFEERVAWVEDNEDMFRRIAEDPLGNREWTVLDDAWQALAATFEWVNFLEEGPDYVCSLPVRVDGSCNGIQHLSAMVRDEVGGRAVNLLPADSPSDIYRDVAEVLTEELREQEGRNRYADLWMLLLNGEAPRSITKRPVMILPYGGTMMAYQEYTMDWLDDADPAKLHIPENIGGVVETVATFKTDEDGNPIVRRVNHRFNAVLFLSKLMWKAVEKKVVKGREVMKWLKDCASVVSAKGLPIYWTTPAGFVVRHFYGTRVRHRVLTHIDGQRMDLVDWDTTPELDKSSASKGIAPNFVHSMDASAMMSCAVRLKQVGVEHFTTIHDSYGTLAADMGTLSVELREAFIDTYREPVLQNFLAACKSVVPDHKKWPQEPSHGSLDLSKVRESLYFFA
jgi:DNA-directed RNA polymerase